MRRRIALAILLLWRDSLVRTFRYVVAGDTCLINVPETDDDLVACEEFLDRVGPGFLAYDTETTGLNIFSPGHELRLVQIGTAREAWVLRLDRFIEFIRKLFRQRRNFIAHNATYDALVIDQHLGIPIEHLLGRTWDTKILAHLADPRGRDEGGIGLDLKNLCATHVDPLATDGERELVKVFNSFGWTKRTGWARIAIDHAAYLIYAGLDVILTSRLFEKLYPLAQVYPELCKMEHKLQYLIALMRRKGMLLDTHYVDRLVIELHNDYVHYCDLAFDFGVESVHANDQVAKQLVAMGEELTAVTPGGALQVDRAVLEPLADLNKQFERVNVREPNPLADAVLRAKRADKWNESYARAFVELRDADNRIHPVINSLQARTARMSINSPPLQQLPSSDWRVRRAFIPDPGMVMIACDYQAIEMRILAALSGDWTMKNAIASGHDLHSFTAEKIYGPDFTNQQRKVAKNVGFGKVYGGGSESVARLTGADPEGVKAAMIAYDKTFPGIRRYSQQLIKRAKAGLLEVVTPIGRRLPLDPDRLYACTNYMVQSTARDVLAQAIIRAYEAGLGEYLLLPVHDELIGQAPTEDADQIVTELGKVMTTTFQGVELTTSPSVVGASWGAAYKAPAVLPMDLPERKERKLREGQWAQETLDLGV